MAQVTEIHGVNKSGLSRLKMWVGLWEGRVSFPNCESPTKISSRSSSAMEQKSLKFQLVQHPLMRKVANQMLPQSSQMGYEGF